MAVSQGSCSIFHAICSRQENAHIENENRGSPATLPVSFDNGLGQRLCVPSFQMVCFSLDLRMSMKNFGVKAVQRIYSIALMLGQPAQQTQQPEAKDHRCEK
jgi:hypothetical protein